MRKGLIVLLVALAAVSPARIAAASDKDGRTHSIQPRFASPTDLRRASIYLPTQLERDARRYANSFNRRDWKALCGLTSNQAFARANQPHPIARSAATCARDWKTHWGSRLAAIRKMTFYPKAYRERMLRQARGVRLRLEIARLVDHGRLGFVGWVGFTGGEYFVREGGTWKWLRPVETYR